MSKDYLGGKPTEWVQPQENNGAIPVNIQDQTTEPFDGLFSQAISTFSLASDATPSTLSVLNYDFDASAGHGLAVNDEILLLDTAANKALPAIVLGVAVNTITLDRPIDHAYPAGANGRKVTSDMTVDGSASTEIFAVRAGSIAVDITRIILRMECASAPDDSKFGDLAALTRGLVFRVVNSFQKTIFNWKTNGEIAQWSFDLTYTDKAGGGNHGVRARITFAGQDKHGVTLRMQDTDQLQVIPQDDLRGLVLLNISAEGHQVTD